MLVTTLNETIKSNFPEGLVEPNAGSVTNQYKVSLAPSSTAPIHFAWLLKRTPSYDKFVSLVFPLEFSTAPTSVDSDDPNLTFTASMYCPFGTSLSSTDLFILPATKFLESLAILFYPLVSTSQIH